MITRHHRFFPPSANWHVVIDDFGNELQPFEQTVGFHIALTYAWASAYRFANGQTFEQAGMRSIGTIVEEH